jgi:hypothetical protein
MTSEQARDYLRGGEGRMVTRIGRGCDWYTTYEVDTYICHFIDGSYTGWCDEIDDHDDNDWYPCDSSGAPIEPEKTQLQSITGVFADMPLLDCDPPAPTWQTKMCGTCGWISGCFCRRVPWMYNGFNNCYLSDTTNETPACPAYVPRS